MNTNMTQNKNTTLSILLLALSFVGLANAQPTILPIDAGYGNRDVSWAFYSGDLMDAGQPGATGYYGIWERPSGTGWPENATISGSATLLRRQESALTIFLNHKIPQGRFYSSPGGSQSLSGTTTKIISNEDGYIKGFSIDQRWSKRGDNAITVGGASDNSSNSTGSWEFQKGTFEGGSDRSGIFMHFSDGFKSYGATFIGGSGSGAMASGAKFEEMPGGPVLIDNHTNSTSKIITRSVFKGADIVNQTISGGGELGPTLSFRSGDGLTAANVNSVTIGDGIFSGSRPADSGSERVVNYTEVDTYAASVDASGGSGAYLESASITIRGGDFQGGGASVLSVGGPFSVANANGGNGLVLQGTSTISDIEATGGFSKPATIVSGGYYTNINDKANSLARSDTEGKAYANGGSGIFVISGTHTLNNVVASGIRASTSLANKTNGLATAHGGSGLTALDGTITINSGNFNGARGGSATAASSYADGGSGVQTQGGTLTINGGTYTGAQSGNTKGEIVSLAREGRGVFAVDTDVTIAGGTFNNGIYFNNSSTHSLTISGGTFDGNIDIDGGGTTSLDLSNSSAMLNGAMNLNGGMLDTTLGTVNDARFFTAFNINNATASFTGSAFTSGTNSTITLEGNSTIDFANALNLVKGSLVDLGGQGRLVAQNGLAIGDDTLVNVGVDFFAGTNGFVNITGNLDGSGSNARILAYGKAIKPTGSVRIADISGSLNQGSNTNLIQANFGWLTQIDNVDTTGGIKIDYVYNELSNSLTGIPANTLTNFDAMLQATNNLSYFSALNSLGAEDGASSIRFAASQASDVVDTSMQAPLQIVNQLANRGTDFRAANKFASTKSFLPQGAAGPEDHPGLTGWIKAYGAHSNRDKDDVTKHDDYDATISGTIIGIDKSFNSVLIGVSGGYASSDLDAESTYSATMDTWHGSVYSTIDGEALYLDIAATYAQNDIDESSTLINGSYKASTVSGYAGVGWKINTVKAITITPTASLLATYYEQDEYTRQIMTSTVTYGDYDEWSYLGSLGANFATAKQLHWENAGIKFIPELRLNWLHEFNPDVNDITVVGGTAPLEVRPREEDMFKLGLGFDMWNWRLQNTLFEIDCDGILGETFTSITVSGKVSLWF